VRTKRAAPAPCRCWWTSGSAAPGTILRAARAVTRLPLLAKGFFSSPADFEQARDAGADAVLILLRDLTDPAAIALLHVARTLGLDTLVEAHDAEELARAAKLEAPVIGINARDLSDFSIHRRRQLELVATRMRS